MRSDHSQPVHDHPCRETRETATNGRVCTPPYPASIGAGEDKEVPIMDAAKTPTQDVIHHQREKTMRIRVVEGIEKVDASLATLTNLLMMLDQRRADISMIDLAELLDVVRHRVETVREDFDDYAATLA
jgi:hypothetical protein